MYATCWKGGVLESVKTYHLVPTRTVYRSATVGFVVLFLQTLVVSYFLFVDIAFYKSCVQWVTPQAIFNIYTVDDGSAPYQWDTPPNNFNALPYCDPASSYRPISPPASAMPQSCTDPLLGWQYSRLGVDSEFQGPVRCRETTPLEHDIATTRGFISVTTYTDSETFRFGPDGQIASRTQHKHQYVANPERVRFGMSYVPVPVGVSGYSFPDFNRTTDTEIYIKDPISGEDKRYPALPFSNTSIGQWLAWANSSLEDWVEQTPFMQPNQQREECRNSIKRRVTGIILVAKFSFENLYGWGYFNHDRFKLNVEVKAVHTLWGYERKQYWVGNDTLHVRGQSVVAIHFVATGRIGAFDISRLVASITSTLVLVGLATTIVDLILRRTASIPCLPRMCRHLGTDYEGATVSVHRGGVKKARRRDQGDQGGGGGEGGGESGRDDPTKSSMVVAQARQRDRIDPSVSRDGGGDAGVVRSGRSRHALEAAVPASHEQQGGRALLGRGGQRFRENRG